MTPHYNIWLRKLISLTLAQGAYDCVPDDLVQSLPSDSLPESPRVLCKVNSRMPCTGVLPSQEDAGLCSWFAEC